MSRRLTLTAIYEPVEDGWTQARIRELPAVITAAPSVDEARDLLLDALREYLLSLGEAESGTEVPSRSERESLEILIGA